MNEDERAAEDAHVIKEGRENAIADWEDFTRMENFSEVPGIYREAGRELWWESYNAQYDLLEKDEERSSDRPDA
nr:hypothetical protein [Brevundimonas naejangsanensis]